ncbi:MAG: PEP-CTERM sorting domain-containing protein [Planctomycetaceae bacterium]
MNPTGSVTSNDVQFNFAVPVPEPSSLVLAALGILGVLVSRRGRGISRVSQPAGPRG